MKLRLLSCLLLLLMIAPTGLAQQEKDEFGISFSGFVKTDIIFDSRQTVTARDGHFLLYPENEVLDANDEDINAAPNFNMLSIQTRLHGKITGPKAFGAKTRGAIEGEFFGSSNSDINGFRLRHAYVNLDWGNTALLVGQTWHPMFVTACYPGVVSFNTGVPFQPFSRNPQVRLTQSFGSMKVIAAAAAQRDFMSMGPDGTTSKYLRNSVVPNMHLQAQYYMGKSLFGAGVDYKSLTPRLAVGGVVADEKVSAISAMAYAKLALDPVTIKLEGVMGNNLTDMLMLGGYGVKSIDETTGVEEYTTLGNISAWGEIIYGDEFQVALFAGVTMNQGAEDNYLGAPWARGYNIDQIMRVSPRLVWNSGKTRIATELEHTIADYGTPNMEDKGKVEDATSISNTRILVAVYYFF